MSKKSEMNETFQKTLEGYRDILAEYVRKDDVASAYMQAHRISGMALFAMKLGIIDWDQYAAIWDEAEEAANSARKKVNAE